MRCTTVVVITEVPPATVLAPRAVEVRVVEAEELERKVLIKEEDEEGKCTFPVFI